MIKMIKVFALFTTTLFGGLSNSHAQFVPPGIAPTQLEQITETLFAFRWGAYRSMFIVSDAGVIVTDPISVEAAAAYRQAIRSVTDLPVTHLVYSHTHWDHAAGGQIFKDEGAEVIAQQGCVKNLQMSPHPDIVPPETTFDKTYSVKSGNQQLDLYYFGPSHDTCLIVMVSPSNKLMFTVDVLTPRPGGNYMPWDPQVADFHFYNAVEYLKQMEQLAIDEKIEIILGAHLVPKPMGKGKFGATESTGPPSSITDRRMFWEKVMGAVKKEMDSGTESFMVPNRVDLSQFEDIPGYRKNKMKELLARIAAYYAIGR
jgi:glyoxylase-like metal-dependent hydrolase (beta-lactamase superfamily II)